MNVFSNYLFIDLPEAFIFLMVGFAVFNQALLPNLRKWAIFGILFSVMTTILSNIELPYLIKILSLFLWMNVLVFFLFRLTIWLTIGVCTSAFIFSITSEFFVLMLFQSFKVNLDQLLHQPYLLIGAVWFYLLLLVLLTILLRKLKFDIRKIIPKSKHHRFLVLVLWTGGIEFLLIMSLSTTYLVKKSNVDDLTQFISLQMTVYLVIILVLYIILVLLFWKYLTLAINRVEEETEKPYLQNIQDLVTAIRSIKHDGINHYTALDGFLKVERYDLAAEYVKHLLKEATDLVQVVEGVKNPAVSALLHSKMAICVANHINFRLEIDSILQFEKMKSKDVTAVLGNLLDNSIRATLQGENNDDRYILLKWGETDKEQFLLIENSGPTIPLEKQAHIYDLGVTTKPSGEGGVGLAVVKNIIDRYNATISLDSKNGVTKFLITLQK
ncbi:sensor histidine kinase [Brevibacillus fluminis]|uniref:sensor histidine kinase n=1 Tax=Brevibacillus fluminis TaxID=511487 RepID=UPI003F8C3973